MKLESRFGHYYLPHINNHVPLDCSKRFDNLGQRNKM